MCKMCRKKVFAIFLLFSFVATPLPVFSTDILGGDALTGGRINDLGGASINSNTGSYAQIGINGNGNTIKWDYMNVGAGKHLDFNFTQAGQVALNKVLGGSISTFAGQLSTSGEAGRLVISNPAGMLFVDGAIVNANSLTLTDKDIMWDGLLDGKLTYIASGTLSTVDTSIKGTNNKRVVFNIADDLNIISINMNVENADLFAGNIKLITANGTNYIQAGKVNINPSWSSGTLKSTNSTYSIKDGSTGSIKLISGNNGVDHEYEGCIKHDGAQATNNTFTANNTASNVEFQNFKTIDNVTINAGNQVLISSTNSSLFTDTIVKNSNITAQSKIVVNEATINNSILTSCNEVGLTGAISAQFATIDNSTLNSYGDIDLSGSTNARHSKVNNSTLNALHNGINLSNSEVFNSDLSYNEYLNIKNATLGNTSAKVLTDSESLNWGRLLINNTSIVDGSDITAKTLIGFGDDGYLAQLTLQNSKLTANRSDINILAGNIKNSTLKSRDKNISFKDTNLDNITATAKDYIKMQKSSYLDRYSISNGSDLTAGLYLDVSNTNISDSSLTTTALSGSGRQILLNGVNLVNSNVNSSFNIYSNNKTTVNNSTLNARNDIKGGSVKFTDSVLTAGNETTLSNAILDNTRSNTTSNKFAFLGGATLKNGSSIEAAKLSGNTYSDTTVNNLYLDNSTIKSRVNDIVIASGTVIGNSNVMGTNGLVNISGMTGSGTLTANASEISLKNTNIGGADLTSTNNINVNNSTIGSLTAHSKNAYFTDTNLSNATVLTDETISMSRTDSRNRYKVENSNLTAGLRMNLNYTDISNSDLKTLNKVGDGNKGINVNNSTIMGSDLNSKFNIYAGNATVTNSDLLAENDIKAGSAKFTDSVLTANSEMSLQNAILNNSTSSALNGKFTFLDGAFLLNGSIVDSSKVTGNSRVDNTINNLTIDGSTLKTRVGDVVLANAQIKDGAVFDVPNNLTLIDANVLNDLNINITGDLTIKGAFINGDLNVLSADDVVIANSSSAPGAVNLSQFTKPARTRYDSQKYNDTYFENILGTYGTAYAPTERISYIGKSLNIANANNVDIVNTVILNSLNETYNQSNIITSYIGNYTDDNASIYKAYIDLPQPINPAYDNDVDRMNYGSECPTEGLSTQQFTPVAFAQGEENNDYANGSITSNTSLIRDNNTNTLNLFGRFIAE